ncbi:MAG: hypothetical protein WA539_11575, partial [Candidatus Sulfotelmatobacter sp.]
FTFTLPVYSLAKLLAPVITKDGRLRSDFVLVCVELRSLTNPPRGNWKEIWRQALEILRRCVYLDKDLVLPPMGTSGAAQTLFVVASTDLQHSGVMTTRIREQLERVGDLKTRCAVTIASVPVEFAAGNPAGPLEQQVQTVADRLTQMILTSMERKHLRAGKGTQDVNESNNKKENCNAKT